MIATLILAVAVSLAELIVWLLFPAALAFLFHLAICAAPAAAAFLLKRERTGIVLVAIAVFFMGPFGAMGAIVMALFASSKRGQDFQAYRRALGPEGETPFSLSVRLAAKPGQALMSFQDVMRWGSRGEKQAALRRMAERYSPVFAGALKQALRDPVPEVRSEAGAALQAILKAMETRCKTLENDIASQTKRDSETFASLLCAYGDAELDVARSGLASPDRTGEALDNALSAYREARDFGATTPHLRLKTAEALMEAGSLAKAANESGQAVAGDEDPTGRALEIHLETLFALGRFADIRRLVASRQGEHAPRRAAALWRAGAAMPHPVTGKPAGARRV